MLYSINTGKSYQSIVDAITVHALAQGSEVQFKSVDFVLWVKVSSLYTSSNDGWLRHDDESLLNHLSLVSLGCEVQGQFERRENPDWTGFFHTLGYLARSGMRIDAIKLLRVFFAVSLLDGKNIVEDLAGDGGQ
jgi:hypothetical protein